jgi:hypothetical protein
MENGSREPHVAILLLVLEEIFAEVERSRRDGDLGWLNPLLVLSAEIEFTSVRATRPDDVALVDRCRELGDLLSAASEGEREFAEGYARAREASLHLRELHRRILMACRFLALRERSSASSSDEPIRLSTLRSETSRADGPIRPPATASPRPAPADGETRADSGACRGPWPRSVALALR